MIAGISAEDCLFADLGFDPASTGCLTFEATDFLIHNRRVDPTCLVILWQIGVVGVEDRPTIEPQVFARHCSSSSSARPTLPTIR